MNLLVVTQTVDREDPVLGFFHSWLIELAGRFTHIHVICLSEGAHSLPSNVVVHSLGKEKKRESSIVYALRFLGLAWHLRRSYDAVLVHMNEEYVLLAGLIWKLLARPVYLWRNHYAGSFKTDLAAMWCTKVFCTSKYSYTAKYKKTVIMPVGVDLSRFHPAQFERPWNSILSVGRLAPSKKVDVFIEALGILKERSISFTADIYGAALPEHTLYEQQLRERVAALGIADRVVFHGAIANELLPEVCASHGIFVNMSPQGMFDKTMVEAAACGAVLLVSNNDAAAALPEASHFIEGDAMSLADGLEHLLIGMPKERIQLQEESVRFAAHHSLEKLGAALATQITGRDTVQQL